MRKRPPTPLSLLADAWTFFRKQRALNAVVLVLFILPAWGIALLARLPDPEDLLGGTALHRFLALNDPYNVVVILCTFLLSLAILWGNASVLLVGQRMIKSRAGRARTSFRAVRRDAAPLVFPLLLTTVLRACFALYWLLLFLVPASLLLLDPACRLFFALAFQGVLAPAETAGGLLNPAVIARTIQHCPLSVFLPLLAIPALLYLVRTSFFQVALVAEGKRYRSALRRSKDVLRRRFWRTALTLVGLALLLFVPSGIVASIADGLLASVDERLAVVADLVGAAVQSLAGALYLLGLTAFFGTLREGKGREIVPPEVS